jgi:phenylacetate-CoA ligase
MNLPSPEHRRQMEHLDSEQLAEHQLRRLNRLLTGILPHNRFYADKLADLTPPLRSLDDLAELPYTFKDELVGGVHGSDPVANLSYPLDRYVRYHRTSGTRGRPMVVLDTAEDWRWWVETWQFVLDAAEIKTSDRAFLAFSFGPFIGFWSAHDALVARGALVIPSGGLSSLARLDLLRGSRATCLFCTPSYALHLAEAASEHQVDVGALDVRHIIVAGEPGGSVAEIKHRIESVWKARVVDHSGASEVGPWGYSDLQGRGLHIVESEFIAEFLSVETGPDVAGSVRQSRDPLSHGRPGPSELEQRGRE